MKALMRLACLLLLLGVALQPILGAALLDLGGFDALAPRMLRLGRVALVALPILTLLIASIEAVPRRERALAGHLALVGAVLMPSALLLAAFVNPAWKYLLPVPALATTAAVLLAARLTWRQGLRVQTAGFATLAASFLLGLTMGLFAFDGPLPSPGFIGAYGDDVRRTLRGLHVGMSVVGLAALAMVRLFAIVRLRLGEQVRRFAGQPATWKQRALVTHLAEPIASCIDLEARRARARPRRARYRPAATTRLWTSSISISRSMTAERAPGDAGPPLAQPQSVVSVPAGQNPPGSSHSPSRAYWQLFE